MNDSLLQLESKPKAKQSLRSHVQPKLEIGQPGDKYEQEADAVADRVMRMSDGNRMQMQPIEEEEEMMQPKLRMQPLEEEEEMLQPKIQMQAVEEEENLQMKPSIINLEKSKQYASDRIDQKINNTKGSGEALPNEVGAEMGFKIGADFSNVNIHKNSQSEQMNQEIGAKAFTIGNDIYFNEGQYNPKSSQGKHLLAHELTHTIQQNGSEQLNKVTNSVLQTTRTSIQKQNASPDVRAMSDVEIRNRIVQIETELAAQTSSSGASNELQTTLTILRNEEAERTRLAPRLNAITARYNSMIADARGRGHHVAADNLQHFLTGNGASRTLGVSWLRGFSEVTNAEQVNQGRFQSSLHDIAISMSNGSTRNFNDYWDRSLTGGLTTELYYASGTSTITSRGNFTLSKSNDIATITGTVDHHWWDPYDWHANLGAWIPGHGVVSDADALLLQRYRQASSFQMSSDWRQSLSGTIEVVNYWPDTVNLTWTGP